MDEHSARSKDPSNLGRCGLWLGNVVERAEVDDHVEGSVAERHLPDVCGAKLCQGSVLAEIRRRLFQQLRIDVEAHQ